LTTSSDYGLHAHLQWSLQSAIFAYPIPIDYIICLLDGDSMFFTARLKAIFQYARGINCDSTTLPALEQVRIKMNGYGILHFLKDVDDALVKIMDHVMTFYVVIFL